jgi:hypothetical protein
VACGIDLYLWMATIELTVSLMPTFNFRLPLPQFMTDLITIGFDVSKFSHNSMRITVKIRYDIDPEGGDKYHVTDYQPIYTVSTVGNERLTAKGLYPTCQHAINMLAHYLVPMIRAGQIPQKSIECPPLSYVQDGLQYCVDFFHAH